MQKNILWIITTILAVSVIGLIIVQSYWISNAIEINKEQFKQIANKALDNIIVEIENREMDSNVSDNLQK